MINVKIKIGKIIGIVNNMSNSKNESGDFFVSGAAKSEPLVVSRDVGEIMVIDVIDLDCDFVEGKLEVKMGPGFGEEKNRKVDRDKLGYDGKSKYYP